MGNNPDKAGKVRRFIWVCSACLCRVVGKKKPDRCKICGAVFKDAGMGGQKGSVGV